MGSTFSGQCKVNHHHHHHDESTIVNEINTKSSFWNNNDAKNSDNETMQNNNTNNNDSILVIQEDAKTIMINGIKKKITKIILLKFAMVYQHPNRLIIKNQNTYILLTTTTNII